MLIKRPDDIAPSEITPRPLFENRREFIKATGATALVGAALFAGLPRRAWARGKFADPLTLMAVGLYGDVLPNQNGAPLRLVVPWKYGFKSGKSIVKIRFTDKQPQTSWNISQPEEYGFFANVNPDVSHPRWSQEKERRIGEFFKRKTLPFNGYADQVAQLYAGLDLRKFY